MSMPLPPDDNAAIELAILRQCGPPQPPRLRFDKVATRVMNRLRATAAQAVPAGRVIVLTITAPIRLPGKTAEALEVKVAALAAETTGEDLIEAAIHGNQVAMRTVRDVARRGPKLIGFVHNDSSDAPLLLDAATAWLQRRR